MAFIGDLESQDWRVRSGSVSVVECSTKDSGAAGFSITGVSVLCH